MSSTFEKRYEREVIRPRRVRSGPLIACLFAVVTTALCFSAHCYADSQASADDPIVQYLARPRFYLIVAVDKIANANANADLPYALVDATRVKTAFEAAGYRPLSDSPPLTGSDASSANIDKLLRDVRVLPD